MARVKFERFEPLLDWEVEVEEMSDQVLTEKLEKASVRLRDCLEAQEWPETERTERQNMLDDNDDLIRIEYELLLSEARDRRLDTTDYEV